MKASTAEIVHGSYLSLLHISRDPYPPVNLRLNQEIRIRYDFRETCASVITFLADSFHAQGLADLYSRIFKRRQSEGPVTPPYEGSYSALGKSKKIIKINSRWSFFWSYRQSHVCSGLWSEEEGENIVQMILPWQAADAQMFTFL